MPGAVGFGGPVPFGRRLTDRAAMPRPPRVISGEARTRRSGPGGFLPERDAPRQKFERAFFYRRGRREGFSPERDAPVGRGGTHGRSRRRTRRVARARRAAAMVVAGLAARAAIQHGRVAALAFSGRAGASSHVGTDPILSTPSRAGARAMLSVQGDAFSTTGTRRPAGRRFGMRLGGKRTE